MRLRWSTPALNDFRGIVEYIEVDNPSAAADVADTIFEGCEALCQFPHQGRRGQIAGTRELVFKRIPYIVVYRVHDEVIELVHIYHGAQDWP